MPRALAVEYDFLFGGRAQSCIAKQTRFRRHQVRQVANTLRRFFLYLRPPNLKRQPRRLHRILQRRVSQPLELRQPLVVGKLIQNNRSAHAQTLGHSLHAFNVLKRQ